KLALEGAVALCRGHCGTRNISEGTLVRDGRSDSRSAKANQGGSGDTSHVRDVIQRITRGCVHLRELDRYIAKLLRHRNGRDLAQDVTELLPPRRIRGCNADNGTLAEGVLKLSLARLVCVRLHARGLDCLLRLSVCPLRVHGAHALKLRC